MKELKVFNYENQEVRTIEKDGKKEYIVNGTLIDRFRLLAIACEAETKEKAREILNTASKIFHPLNDSVFNTLYSTAAMEITWKFTEDEFYYHQLFKKNYQKIRKGKVVKNKSDGKNMPDAWVEENGYIIPVEIKLKRFDNKALAQLKRYMKVYGSKKGIAVARELTVDLPRNIEFISFEELNI